MNIPALKEKFAALYGKTGEDIRAFFAPGRVNLIGEHTDYNDGFVLPAAISFGTYLLARPNNRQTLRLATTNFDYKAEVPLTEISQKHPGQWVNYPLGVINEFNSLGKDFKGLDMLYSGDIPAAAGLSSSASIELVTAVALNEMFGHGLTRAELVKIGVRAERGFVGVQCGIMDQFIVGQGKAGSALFLNCATEEFRHVPFDPPEYQLVIADSKKPRQLSDSKYNERVSECRAGVEAVCRVKPVGSLSEIVIEELEALLPVIENETVRKRVRHIVTENQRVQDAVGFLEKGDYLSFGHLMNASHASLRDDYEVTGSELDAMVNAARRQAGVPGSRMTGAGFGGCAVSLVRKENVEDFIRQVRIEYKAETGFDPDFYLPEISDGAGEIRGS